TLSDNSAVTGGAISNDFNLTLENVTLSGNMASGSGGALRNNMTATLTNVTFANNSADVDGGGAIMSIGDITAKYTIVASSPSGGNCANFGNLTSNGHNIDSDGTCGFTGTGDLVADPLIGPLQLNTTGPVNSGPPLTHQLLTGSLSIHLGGTDCPSTDQRR